MVVDDHVQIVTSVLAGGSATLLLAKAMIARTLKDLEMLTTRVQNLSERLAIVSTRLERLADHDEMLKDHSEKIARFEVSNGVVYRPLNK